MTNIVYSRDEKVKMVQLYHAANNNARIARELFTGLHPDRPIPEIATIVRTIKQFNTEGCVQNGHEKISYPSRQVPDDLRIRICASFEANSVNSTNNIVEELNTSEATVYRVLKSAASASSVSPAVVAER